MTARLGGDVAAMRRVAAQLRSDAAKVRSLRAELAAGVGRAWWQGADADRFRSAWSSDYDPQLRRVASELESAAERLVIEASRQEAASA